MVVQKDVYLVYSLELQWVVEMALSMVASLADMLAEMLAV